MRPKHMDLGMFLLCSVMMLFSCTAQAQDLLSDLRKRHHSHLESIHTYYCKITCSQTPSGSLGNCSGEYWRALGAVRIKWKLGINSYDTIYKDFKVYTLQRSRRSSRTRTSGIIAKHSGLPQGFCDVWFYGMLSFYCRQTERVGNLEELLVNTQGTYQVRKESLRGKESIVLTFSEPDGYKEIWFNPQVNFLVEKKSHVSQTTTPKPLKHRIESVVTRFTEVVPGIFFPNQIKTRHYLNDTLKATESITLSKIRINDPLPPDIFRLRFPAKTMVNDTIMGKRYRVNADGQTIGPLLDLPKIKPLPPGVYPRTETQYEPKSWTGTILPIALCVLIVAVSLAIVKQWKRIHTE